MSIETFKQQLMERKLKDLTPEAFDVLFNYAFGNLMQAERSAQETPSQAIFKAENYKPAEPEKNWRAVVGGGKIEATFDKPLTKNARALQVLARHPKGLTAAELAKITKEEVRLVYPLLSNLKREGKVRWNDGVYSVRGAK